MEKHYKIRKQIVNLPFYQYLQKYAIHSSVYKTCYITEPLQWHLSSLFDFSKYEISKS